MAISTFDELRAAIAEWLNRDANFTELVNRIPDFIALCEARLNDDLRTREMEVRTDPTTYQTAAGTATLAVPADYLEARRVILKTSPARTLAFSTPDTLSVSYGDASGAPEAYTIIGDALEFGPVPDGAYPVEMTYYARIPALSASNPTNWVLTKRPALYLYGALIESAPFLQDDERVASWGTLYEAALGRVQATDERARWGGAPLTVKVRPGW